MIKNKLLEVIDLKKSFKDPSLVELFSGINFSLSSSEVVAIMGPSGEGKTTFLHLIAGLEKPSSGKIVFLGKDLVSWDPAVLRNQHIGLIFQNFNLIEELSALENVLLPVRIAKKPIFLNEKRAKALLVRVGLGSRIHFPCKILSGGEKQRVAIARSFINNPDLILVDEPTGNLDHTTAKEIHSLLLSTARSEKKALLIVTHNVELASQCDCIYTLQSGKINPLKSKPFSVTKE